jgi:hypothetical protein
MAIVILIAAVSWWVRMRHLEKIEAREYYHLFKGHTAVQWLKLLSNNPNADTNILRLNQVITGDEPQNITYEFPILFEQFTNHDLYHNDRKIVLFLDDEYHYQTGLFPATNGNMQLSWDTTSAPAGLHRLHAELWLLKVDCPPIAARGPVSEFVSSNLCHVNPFMTSQYFKGVILYANLTVSNAVYTIKLQDTNGRIVKAISNTTTNAIIDERWDLVDSFGQSYRQPTVKAIYLVTVPNFISQTVEQIYRIESQ